jgi:hypothetical protein
MKSLTVITDAEVTVTYYENAGPKPSKMWMLKLGVEDVWKQWTSSSSNFFFNRYTVCLFSWRYNPLWLYFHSPVAGFSLIVFEVSWSHTTTRHSRYDSSGRVINPSHRPPPDNTQHSQQTSKPPVGFEPTISAGERPNNYTVWGK